MRDSPADVTPRAWQRMLSGRRLDLLDPSPVDIEITDIAHGLARVARWNGQTLGETAFSVAQHSVLVEALCVEMFAGFTPRNSLYALLHDAPEYVIGDMISPFKTALGFDYKVFERRLEGAIHVRFGLPAAMPAFLERQIKQADNASARMEATQLAGFTDEEARQIWPDLPAGVARDLEPLGAVQAQEMFLKRFETLLAAFEASRATGRKAHGTDKGTA